MRLEIAGEDAVILYFDNLTLVEANNRVRDMVNYLERDAEKGILDLVPAYDSLLVIYDSLVTDIFFLKRYLNVVSTKLQSFSVDDDAATDALIVPVYYAPPIEHDLERMVEFTGLSQEQIIAFHQQRQYRVYCLGFAPGFAFLGEVDPRIAVPRLSTPRKNVPTGAVAIADNQTAIYPTQSPGGWNIIGLCPLTLFNLKNTPPTPFYTGLQVKFEAIDQHQYLQMGGKL